MMRRVEQQQVRFIVQLAVGLNFGHSYNVGWLLYRGKEKYYRSKAKNFCRDEGEDRKIENELKKKEEKLEEEELTNQALVVQHAYANDELQDALNASIEVSK